MSASESLGRQWTIRSDHELGGRQVRAYSNTGKHVGSLNWSRPLSEDEPPRVFKAVVHEEYRRQGVGRALWNAARNIEPNLHHSLPHALSADGERFAAGTPVTDPITPVKIKPSKSRRPW